MELSHKEQKEIELSASQGCLKIDGVIQAKTRFSNAMVPFSAPLEFLGLNLKTAVLRSLRIGTASTVTTSKASLEFVP